MMKHSAIVLLLLTLTSPALAAKGGPKTSVPILADFVAHTAAFVPAGPMLLSRCSGAATGRYHVEWPRHDLCVFTATFDALGNIVGSDSGVKPSGMEAATRTKELCAQDELCDDPILTAGVLKGRIESIQFFIQDDIGPDGVQYETETVVLDTPAQTAPCGFVVHVHREGIPVWQLAGHTGGPRVKMAGTISIGDVWYRPATPCSE